MYPLNLASTVILFDQSPMQPKLHCYGHQVHIDQYRINLYHIRYRHTHIDKTGTPGQIRTPNHMLLRQAALPISVRGQNNFGVAAGYPHMEVHILLLVVSMAILPSTFWCALQESNLVHRFFRPAL